MFRTPYSNIPNPIPNPIPGPIPIHDYEVWVAWGTSDIPVTHVLRNSENYCAAYLDGVVIHSSTWKDHLQYLCRILRKISEAGLTLNMSKCEWERAETSYMGFQLGESEVRPQVNKFKAFCNCPRPRRRYG